MKSLLRLFTPRIYDSNFLIIKCSIFSEARLKIDHFKKEKKFYEKKYANNTEPIRTKLEKSIKENKPDYALNDLVAMLHLSKTTADLNLAVNAAKLLLSQKKIPTEQYRGLGILVMRLVYFLDNPSIGLKLLENKDLKDLFGFAGYSYFILMNKLSIQKDYEGVLKLFEKQVPHFTIESSSSKTITTSVPFDQLSLYCHALLSLNNKNAFDRMNALVNFLDSKGSKLNNLCLARCFKLSIQQKEYEYALRLLQKFDHIDHSLNLNLATIALCELDLISDALKIAGDLMKIGLEMDNNKFSGRFFKQTLNSLKEASERSTNKEIHSRYAHLAELIEKKRNVLAFDLSNYCNDLNY